MEIWLKHTKNKLTIIFSVIVFVLVLTLWLIYFSTKYIKESKIEKSEFKEFTNFLIENKQNSETIINKSFRFGINRFEKWATLWQIPPSEIKPINRNTTKPKNFINFILIDENKKIISSDTKDEIENKFLNYLIEKSLFSEITINWWIIFTKIKIDDWRNTLILFKKLRYTSDDYRKDILWFILINIIFSILVYAIWFKFVDKTLGPVEQNLRDMKDFVHNAWHELKTPLSVMDSNLQLMKDVKKFDIDMIWEIKSEVSKLNSLIDSLINLSNIKSKENHISINLKETIEDILKDYKLKIEEKKNRYINNYSKNNKNCSK